MTDTGSPATEEDKFNAKFTQEYVDFIKERPWYEFDFRSRLNKLWTSTSFFGNDFLRKMERKYIFTSELLVKFGYAKLIGLGTKQVYETALPTTAVVLENDSLQSLPRYDRFADVATILSKNGRSFKEIAGNNSAILLTILIPSDSNPILENARTIFIQPIASDPSMKRIALATQVSHLSPLLKQLDSKEIKVEHVFDY
jgi:hypothetical protein